MKNIKIIYNFVKKCEKFYYDKLTDGKDNEQDTMILLQVSAYQRIRLFIEDMLKDKAEKLDKEALIMLQEQVDSLKVQAVVLEVEKVKNFGYFVTYVDRGQYIGDITDNRRTVFAKDFTDAVLQMQRPMLL